MAYTSIQISPQTRALLAALRTYPRETYDELLNKLIALVPEGDEEGKYTDEFRAGMVRARLDLKHGRTISHAELKKRMGL